VWVDLLRSAGFEAAATLPEPSSPANVLKQHLVLARVEGSAPTVQIPVRAVTEQMAERHAALSAKTPAPEIATEVPSHSAVMAAILDAPEGDREELAIAEIRDAVVAVLRL